MLNTLTTQHRAYQMLERAHFSLRHIFTYIKISNALQRHDYDSVIHLLEGMTK
jgi:hypothetical protein